MRLRRDVGRSFLSFLATAREIDGGAHNHVFGPDFQWRPRPADSFTGQALWSESRTLDRPDLAAEWDGRSLSDRALLLNWSHYTDRLDWFVQGQDLGPHFRADDGFIPEVGIGLRKALGATYRNILTQFFIEGAFLATFSGGIGLAISAGFMTMLAQLPSPDGFDTPRVVPSSAITAILCLAIAGVAAGLYPARKAALLPPVEALRSE